MKRILILILFSTFALNAMEQSPAELQHSKAKALLNAINTALDNNDQHEYVRKLVGDKIPGTLLPDLRLIWGADLPTIHARTMLFITQNGLKKVVEEEVYIDFGTSCSQLTKENINQIITKWQNAHNNAQKNLEYINAVERENNLNPSLEQADPYF